MVEKDYSFICKKCGTKVIISGLKFKGQYYCSKCNPDKYQNELENAVINIFNRYNYRNDIENELTSLGFEEFFGDPDEKIYFTSDKPHDILVYVNWIDSCFWIYKRIFKESM